MADSQVKIDWKYKEAQRFLSLEDKLYIYRIKYNINNNIEYIVCIIEKV